jgi:acetyl-CoA carboxylase biotin carboxyl carrier protein
MSRLAERSLLTDSLKNHASEHGTRCRKRTERVNFRALGVEVRRGADRGTQTMEITLKQLKSLLKTLEEGSVTEFEYQDDKYRLRMCVGRGGSAAGQGTALAHSFDPRSESAPVALTNPAPAADDPNLVFVTSPFVGTFYRSSNPETGAFVEMGASVKKGQTLCIVEAMKLMNEIEAEFPCTILEILVENGASVEFGQKLFKVERS